MALNPTGGDSHNWNYSNPDKPGYSLELVGTVKAIQEVQAMKFSGGNAPSGPDFWPDGNPKMNIRIVLCGPSGGVRTLTFPPASKAAKAGEKPSLHIDIFKLAGGQDITNIKEKTIKISTDAPPAGFGYGKGAPRPWRVELVEGMGPFELKEPLDPKYLVPRLLSDQAVSGGMVNAPQQAADPTDGSDLPF